MLYGRLLVESEMTTFAGTAKLKQAGLIPCLVTKRLSRPVADNVTKRNITGRNRKYVGKFYDHFRSTGEFFEVRLLLRIDGGLSNMTFT